MSTIIGNLLYVITALCVISAREGLQNIAALMIFSTFILAALIAFLTVHCTTLHTADSLKHLQGIAKAFSDKTTFARVIGWIKTIGMICTLAYFGMFITAVIYILGIPVGLFIKHVATEGVANHDI